MRLREINGKSITGSSYVSSTIGIGSDASSKVKCLSVHGSFLNSFLFSFLFCVIQLSKEVVDLDELRKLASEGIPDVAGIRSTVWKVLHQITVLNFFLSLVRRISMVTKLTYIYLGSLTPSCINKGKL